MKKKVTTYKGFKIRDDIDDITGKPVFKVYTKEEWAHSAEVRCYEWEACSMKEAADFVDLYEQGVTVTMDSFLDYLEVTGFRLFNEEE
ncbi:hypothetical protein [Paenibacillus sp.]|jgi:hypothetical protein|uniref:hypothetical protein n=1 Tax=Paenibacillus sp. TaxID=58172 RepID=UPI0028187426|nr:hypothetical protein [Paenibacillus sp.]MDR0269610.1 hypothetical protein [Paenibacillus sp.]